MFLLLLTCIVTVFKMATQGRHGGSKKENYIEGNYILHRYLNDKYQRKAFTPFRGMTDLNQTSSPQHIRTGTKLSLPHNIQSPALSGSPVHHLKRPLKLTNNNNNVPEKPQKNNRLEKYELNDEILRNNVAIVLNNLNQRLTANKQQLIESFLQQGGGPAMSTSPGSDCNSNNLAPNANGTFSVNAMLPIGCSIASSQDFTHDNSDYQWFLDYGYRDGGLQQQPQSVLSSLSASYSGIGELSYYEDLAKNIDANLAEVDMESFRTEDIHSLLTKLPSFDKATAAANRQKLSLNDLDNSICKSELLFSPVKESHISVDSLDMEGLADEADIILTCKANKDNYTIAFEGSAMYSDDSFYGIDGPEFNQGSKLKQNSINYNNFSNKLLTTPVPGADTGMSSSMSKSESGAYTTWSKLRQSNSALASHENETPEGEVHQQTPEPHLPLMIRHLPHCFVNKSSSMPNLKTILNNQQQSHASEAISNSSVDSYGNQRALLPHYPMPISTTESESPNAPMMQQSNDDVGESQEPPQNVPSFNLVKLFIKQKSSSTDTCMDVSSGCWPSDSSGSDNANNNGSGGRARKKSMNDSGKGSDRLSRHEEEYDESHGEEEERYDSLEPVKITNTAVNSPVKRMKDLHYNIRNHLKHPALYNLYKHTMNNSLNNNLTATTQDSDTSRTSENLTQIFNINKSRCETMTKSIQTSMANVKDSIRVVPPSFLAKIQQEMKKERTSVFVVYPNYALPDLEFVKAQPQVILSPVGPPPQPAKSRRPASLNDIDSIRKRVAHNKVIDWRSLWTLLPPEYRKILRTIPEAQEQCMDASMSSQKPMFSMTPPIFRTNRGVSCDCASVLSSNTHCSSSGGSSGSHVPSSGYRGSSTLLTDSEFGAESNLYVYQYQEDQPAERPPRPSAPTPAPKGILRRANTARTASRRVGQGHEKRRSLQEPFYAQTENIIEEFVDEKRPSNLLLNYPKQREAYEDHRLHCDNKMDVEARLRAEQFLINVPKSELKHYAEIANILEEAEPSTTTYNSYQLRDEVSRALSNAQRRVQFSKPTASPTKRSPVGARLLKPNELRFTTPPNSPNMSVMTGAVKKASPTGSAKKDLEKEKQEKIQSNRFKRLQIQWELLSKEANQRLETKSGQTTPTSAQKSRIPRPVSYPAGKAPEKNLKSPSRIVPPKKYSAPTPTPTPRTPSKTAAQVAHTTPKKSTVARAPVVRTR